MNTESESGLPEIDAPGTCEEATPSAVVRTPLHQAVPIEDILASAPGPDPHGGIELTDDEFAEFWAVLHT